jgi:hypothetical protein
MAILFFANRKDLIALDNELRSGAAGEKAIPFSVSHKGKVDIAAGICELDPILEHDVLDGFSQTSGGLTYDTLTFDQITSVLVRARLCDLHDSGLQAPAELRLLLDFTQKHWPDRQPLRLGSVLLVMDDVEEWRWRRRGGVFFARRRLDASRIFNVSVRWGISLAEGVELAKPLVGLGVVVPDLDQLAGMPQPDPRQMELLSRDLDGGAPFVDQLNIGQLIKASGKWGIPLAEVMELARPLAGFVAPDLDRLAAVLQTDARLPQLLSWGLEGTVPVVDQVDVGQLIKASAKWGIPLAEVVKLARPLVGFGLVTPDLDRLAAMPQLDATRAFRIAGSLEGNLSPHQMILQMLARAEHLSVAEISSFSRDLKDAGLYNVSLPDLDTSLDEKLLRLMARTISWHDTGCSIDPLSVAFLASRARYQITDLRPALDVLASVDVDCAEALEFVQFCAERNLVVQQAGVLSEPSTSS